MSLTLAGAVALAPGSDLPLCLHSLTAAGWRLLHPGGTVPACWACVPAASAASPGPRFPTFAPPGHARPPLTGSHLMKVFSLEQHSMIMVASSISWPVGMPCTCGWVGGWVRVYVCGWGGGRGSAVEGRRGASVCVCRPGCGVQSRGGFARAALPRRGGRDCRRGSEGLRPRVRRARPARPAPRHLATQSTHQAQP